MILGIIGPGHSGVPVTLASLSTAGFADRLLAIPAVAKWALALVGISAGLFAILRTDAVVRGIRRWLLVQLRWIRRPGYRQLTRIYGWLLFVCGVALATLLVVRRGAA